MLPINHEEEQEETYFSQLGARLGAAKQNSPGKLFLSFVFMIALVIGIFYVNFKAMGMATGATGPIVKHGAMYTFGQPWYSMWALYYIFVGSKK